MVMKGRPKRERVEQPGVNSGDADEVAQQPAPSPEGYPTPASESAAAESSGDDIYAAMGTLRHSAQEDARAEQEDMRVSGEQQLEAALASVEAKREETEEQVEAARSEFAANVGIAVGVATTSVAGAAAESPIAEIAGLGVEEIADLPIPLPEPAEMGTAPIPLLEPVESAAIGRAIPFGGTNPVSEPLPEPAGEMGLSATLPSEPLEAEGVDLSLAEDTTPPPPPPRDESADDPFHPEDEDVQE